MVKPVVISTKQGLVQKKLPKQDGDLDLSSCSLERSIIDDKKTVCRKCKKDELNGLHQETVSWCYDAKLLSTKW